MALSLSLSLSLEFQYRNKAVAVVNRTNETIQKAKFGKTKKRKKESKKKMEPRPSAAQFICWVCYFFGRCGLLLLPFAGSTWNAMRFHQRRFLFRFFFFIICDSFLFVLLLAGPGNGTATKPSERNPKRAIDYCDGARNWPTPSSILLKTTTTTTTRRSLDGSKSADRIG